VQPTSGFRAVRVVVQGLIGPSQRDPPRRPRVPEKLNCIGAAVTNSVAGRRRRHFLE